MIRTPIAFIGGGNMARSLIGGLLADGCPAALLRVAEPSAGGREALRAQYGVQTSEHNPDVIDGAGVVVLAVKPQILREVALGIAEAVQHARPLVVSIAAGVRLADIGRWLGGHGALVRTMPNTPALVKSGATALYAAAGVSVEQRRLAESILRAVGLTVWVDDEARLDAVTALSGSGPAYFFLVMEAMEAAARTLGLPADTARLLTLQTAFGAARIALESSESPAELRARVTSPKGTTEAALQVLKNAGIEAIFAEALAAAAQRSRELGDLFADTPAAGGGEGT
ncbi:MAG TPA: pyrroline-5-carboxylate reductase [Plasticicumulans sp.]|uniref:pyrroline-5-carboxylate reductase n=2 Tax=Plasticicumulans sp. TaxID=2307179 RepID=UPI002BF32354|nr:pyrroline-5-carboxylate reductase [Plasticicumulans sp.]HMW44129.1 pyrroline-5-carboxylate reductase [Plasticicumulans sp.]HNF65515.1 pyrroline-5-carboxylate reductase [Plasticicumulans sp.]HNG50857.1 pyrroline-5-carboxylate reductase [Plasticicumulans sp.]HNK31828.1 pyrroline-5-carboxylate reductase [Plasticicumulans sp.]HNO61606.1 pyrroline-5-carboxylate reductase [Plasticicumulans sp.]